jgi:phage terminase large subunit-like protein
MADRAGATDTAPGKRRLMMARRRASGSCQALEPAPERPRGRRLHRAIFAHSRRPLCRAAFDSAPWQKQEIYRIYDHPVRRAIISTGKKNGKIGLCAALLLDHLVGASARNHRNARLFSSAMSRDQAALTFDAARKMILLNSDLRQTIAIKESAKVLRNDDWASSTRPCPAKPTGRRV